MISNFDMRHIDLDLTAYERPDSFVDQFPILAKLY